MSDVSSRVRPAALRCRLPRPLLLAVTVLAATVSGGPLAPPALAAQQGATGGNWLYYGGDAGSTKYSPLDQIDADNVADLEIAWRWESRNFGDRPEFNYRATPLAVDGIAVRDGGVPARGGGHPRGDRRDPVDVPHGRGRCAGRPLRAPTRAAGVAYWSDGEAERILFITPAYHMVSLDAKTGRPDPAFGEDGVVDLRRNFGPREVDLDERPAGLELPARDRGRRGGGRNGAAVRQFTPKAGHASRPCARLRRAHRRAPVDLPHHPPGGRVRQRYLAGRVLALYRQRGRLDPVLGGSGARLRIPAHRSPDG